MFSQVHNLFLTIIRTNKHEQFTAKHSNFRKFKTEYRYMANLTVQKTVMCYRECASQDPFTL